MSEQSSPERRRVLWKLFLGLCAFCLLGFGVIAWFVSTDVFQQWVRRRVVASLEKTTGGGVELGELHTIPFRLRIDVRDLTLHGREEQDQSPFVHVDRLQAQIKIISLFSTTFGLHSLDLDHPTVHLIDYPDGTTNAPVPGAALASGRGPVEDLLDLAVTHITVRRGELLWEDKNVPFEFSGSDLALFLHYSLLRQRYESQVRAGRVNTRFRDYPSFVWSADASFILTRGRADIANLALRSGKSEVHFTGVLQGFHDPKLTGDYRGVADLAEAAALAREPHIRRGTAQFEGKVAWNLRDFATHGSVHAADMEWADPKLSMKNGRLAGEFSVTPDRVRVSAIKAALLGGELSGEVEVQNWQSSVEGFASAASPDRVTSPGPKRKHVIGRVRPENLQRGSVRLQVAGFPVAPALELLSSKKLPLDRLGLQGNASGNVETLWVGSIRDAETHMKLSVSPPLKPAPGGTTIQGQLDGTYRGSRGEIAITQLNLATPGSQITAAGELSPTSSLRFSLNSHNLREWTPLLEAAYGDQDLPVAIRGWASLTGTASGTLSSISTNGNLDMYDFEATLPSASRGAASVVHFDAVTSALQYSSSHFAARNGSLVHGKTVVHFEGSAALAQGAFLENAPFTLRFDFRNADAGEVARLAGVEQPVTGAVDFAANFSGTRADPHGDGHVAMRSLSIDGNIIPTLSSDLGLAEGELQFNNIDANLYGAPITGSAAVNVARLIAPSAARTQSPTRDSDVNAAPANDWRQSEVRVNVIGRNLDLARFARLQTDRFTADGVADFNLRLSGTVAQPVIDAHASLKGVALNKEPLGDFTIDAETHDQRLAIKSHSDFKDGDLNVGGNVALDRDFNADLKLAFHRFDIDSLLSIYLPGKITAHAPADGILQVSGPLRSPRDLKASAEISSFTAEVEHVQVHAVEPVRFGIAAQTLSIESFHVAGTETDFTAQGRAHLSGDQGIDMRLDGSVNLTLLQSLNPKILARGKVGVNLTAEGTLAEPVLQGRLELSGAFVSHNDFPSGLSDLNGVLLFDRNRIQIQSLHGTTGGGTVNLTGYASYQKGIVDLDFGATAHAVRLRYPPGVSSTADADLRLSGTSKAAQLTGDVVVTKLAVTPGFDFEAYIERSKQTAGFTRSDSLASRLKFDVHVTTTPDLQMQTASARLSGDADLRIRGTADRPAILGRVEVLEGELSFNGNKYNLERGDVTFSNPAKTQPVIDLAATTRVRDYDITVQIRGDASVTNGLKVSWQSEPQLPEADVIALLALGRTQEESAAAQSSGSFGFGGDASNLLINQALNSTVNSRLQKLFGASRVKIDPQGLATETNVVRGPQVTVEQQVASNLTLTYSTNVSVSNQQIIQLEYNITRNISIVALRDQNGVVSFDFKLRRRHK